MTCPNDKNLPQSAASADVLTGLFAISGYSGKASGRFFGGFGGDFPVVFGLLPGENSEKKFLNSL